MTEKLKEQSLKAKEDLSKGNMQAIREFMRTLVNLTEEEFEEVMQLIQSKSK